jgi:hypothetical protein
MQQGKNKDKFWNIKGEGITFTEDRFDSVWHRIKTIEKLFRLVSSIRCPNKRPKNMILLNFPVYQQ